MPDRLRIGDLARLVSLPTKTIRYYEEIGLLPPAKRSAAGYRLYSREDIERLILVRRSKLLGLSLREIEDLVGCADEGQCEHLRRQLLEMLDAKRTAIDRQMEELRALKDDLSDMARAVAARLSAGETAREEASFCSCLEGSPLNSVEERDTDGRKRSS